MSIDNEETKKAWVKRVKELMPKAGFKTYQDLAYKAGISAGSLNQAMRGMHLPRQTTIEKIANALGTTPQFLLYGDTMKASQRIPLLDSAAKVLSWLHDDSPKIGMAEFVEPSGKINLSNQAFAWKVSKNNMEPLFLFGDIVIFDSIPPAEKLPPIVLATEMTNDQEVDNLQVTTDNWLPDDRLLFGIIDRTNSGDFLISKKTEHPKVLISNTHQILGIAIQQIRNFQPNLNTLYK